MHDLRSLESWMLLVAASLLAIGGCVATGLQKPSAAERVSDTASTEALAVSEAQAQRKIASGIPFTRFLPDERTPASIRAALQEASDYSARTGRPVDFGPDTLDMQATVDLREGTHFRGAEGSLIRRAADGNSYNNLFEINAGNIRIEGLAFDVNGGGEYTTFFAIRSGGIENLYFENLHFYDTDEPDPRQNYGDRFAILVAPVRGAPGPVQNLHVTDCIAENGIQLTAGYGGRGLRDAWITGNRVVEAEANAIALVMAGSDVGGGLENIHITDNTIIRPRSAGIYVGVDRHRFAGSFQRGIYVERNRLLGVYPRGRGHFAILIRAAELYNEDIIVRDNLIDARGYPDLIGIRFEAKDQSNNPNLPAGEKRFFDAPIIEGNRFIGSHPAIDLWHVRGGHVIDNRVDSDAIRLVRTRDITLHGNSKSQ